MSGGQSGRARGRHTARTGEGNGDELFLKGTRAAAGVDPDSLEGHKLGISKRVQGAPSPIPGGKDHILNAPTFRQRPEAANPADFPDTPDQNAHGVPPASHNGRTRAQAMRGKGARDTPDQYYADPPPAPVRPIPVIVVPSERAGVSYRTAAPRRTTVPANTLDPIVLCGRDPDRVQVLLLNEDPANAVRFAATPADLTGGEGSLLPAGMGSYLRLPTQESLYALSATGTAATVSVIQIWETGGSGL